MSDDSTIASDVLQAPGHVSPGPAAPSPIAPPRLSRDVVPVFRELSSSTLTQPADLELMVSIEVGRVHMRLDDVAQLPGGSMIQLDKLAGDAVDIVIHEQLVARGEVVEVDGKFAVRIVQVIANAAGVQH